MKLIRQMFWVGITSATLLYSGSALSNDSAVTLGVETFAPVLGGAEAELGYNFGPNRITVHAQTGGMTPWYTQAADFEDTGLTDFSVGYNRFLSAEQKGWYFGVQYDYVMLEVENEAGQALEDDWQKIDARIGYMWFPFADYNFFVDFMMTGGYYVVSEDLQFDNGDTFDAIGVLGNGPLVRLSWKFDL